MKKKLTPTNIYLIYTGASAFLFILMKTIRDIYRKDVANIQPFELILIGTTLEITHLLFEGPTGIIADRYSRKLSVIIGLILVSIAFIFEGLFPMFIVIIFCQFILGVGDTFTSGADEAWIADELNGEKLEHVFLKGAQVGQILSIIGIILSIFLGAINLSIPFILSGGLFFLLAIFLMFFMNETQFEKQEVTYKKLYQHIFHTILKVTQFIKSKPILLFMVLVTLFHGLFSEGFDRLWTYHFLEDIKLPNIHFPQLPLPSLNESVIWIGLISLTAMLLSIIAVEYMKRKLKKTGKLEKVWILLFINLLMVISLYFFAVTNQFEIALGLYVTFYIARRINRPVYRAWMNQHIESKIRATVLSTFGQLDSIGQIIGGLIISAIVYHTSITTGITVAALILSPVIIIYLLFIRKIKMNKVEY